MPRAPEPGDACRPGGRCDTCNDPRIECWECSAPIQPEDAIRVRIGARTRDLCGECAAELGGYDPYGGPDTTAEARGER